MLAVFTGCVDMNSSAADAARSWGSESGGLVASLSVASNHFESGESILVQFQLKNVAGRRLQIAHSGIWPNHRLAVTNAEGDSAALTARGKEVHARFGLPSVRKNFFVTLEPGETDEPEASFDLTEYFEIVGPTTLRVRCLFQHGEHAVWSNELVLEVS